MIVFEIQIYHSGRYRCWHRTSDFDTALRMMKKSYVAKYTRRLVRVETTIIGEAKGNERQT